jgi:hypothetical protein
MISSQKQKNFFSIFYPFGTIGAPAMAIKIQEIRENLTFG